MDMDLAEARTIHDVLLSDMQDGERSSHSCELCAESNADTAADAAPEIRKEETSMEAIYTQEQADSLIAAARAEEQSKVTEAVASKEAELQELVTKLQADLAELQAKRDEDQLELSASKEKVTELEGEIASRDEAVARTARREVRLKEVSEVASFTDKYVSENVDRWVDMSDADFASYLEAIRELRTNITEVAEVVEDTVVPEDTAMNNEHVDTVATPARRKLFDALKGGNL